MKVTAMAVAAFTIGWCVGGIMLIGCASWKMLRDMECGP